jgi:hypothetical protein
VLGATGLPTLTTDQHVRNFSPEDSPGSQCTDFKPTRARHRQMQDVEPFAMKLRVLKTYKDVETKKT